ncbi:MAG: class I SAM-dependent methyltransferase [Acidobacteriota bacterium]
MQPTPRALQRTAFILILAGCSGLPASIAWADEPPPTNWKKYYERTAKRPPRPVLLDALQRFAEEGRSVGQAVDAGCGSGIDTLYLLAEGIAVHAFDTEPAAIEALRKDLPPELANRLRTEVAPFHQATWDDDVDLVFAGFALPFAHPDDFDSSWRQLVDALAVGGRFAGHLFGDRDDWAARPDRTHHTREQAEALLGSQFEIEVFEEIEDDRKSGGGRMKHWHYYEIIAKKVRD